MAFTAKIGVADSRPGNIVPGLGSSASPPPDWQPKRNLEAYDENMPGETPLPAYHHFRQIPIGYLNTIPVLPSSTLPIQNVPLIARDPDPISRVLGRATDMLSAVFNSLARKGQIVQIGPMDYQIVVTPSPLYIAPSQEPDASPYYGILWVDAAGDIHYLSPDGNDTTFGDGITALTGGVTATGPGSAVATVITNANLTGPITSVGNATAVAAQTGTGSTFVMNTSPTLVTPILGVATATTINGIAIEDNGFTTGFILSGGTPTAAILQVTGDTVLVGGTHSGTNTGDQTDIPGNAETVTVNDAAGDTTTWVMLARDQVGEQSPTTDAGITYNATTNTLTTTTFVGALTGTATNASEIGITDDSATNALMYPVWVEDTSMFSPAKISSTKITFNPSSGQLTANSMVASLFTGSLLGDVTGTATALATGRTISITGDISYTSPVFDGSTDVTAAATLNVAITPTWSGQHTFQVNPIITNAAPGLIFTDTTASAKGLTILVDGDVASFYESAASSTSLFYLDLVNNAARIGNVFNAALGVSLSLTNSLTAITAGLKSNLRIVTSLNMLVGGGAAAGIYAGMYNTIATETTSTANYTVIVAGSFYEAIHQGSGTIATMSGLRCTAQQNASTGAITTAHGVLANLAFAATTATVFGFVTAFQVNNASGAVTTAVMFEAAATGTMTGTATSVFGFRAGNFGKSGVTNAVGVAINAQSAAATSNTCLLIGTLTPVAGTWAIYNSSTATNYFAGTFGIGVTSATAILHLKAGTATANTAPLKFNSGTLLATAEAGAMEFLTDALYFTITTGAARKTVAFLESPTFTGTVGLPIATLTGKVTNYNSIATVSNGVPSELATIDLTAQTANKAATTLYAVPASGAGMYRVNAYVVLTTAASVSSTLPNVQVVYTDNDTSGAITLDATPTLGIAGIGQTGALTANTIGTVASGVVVINVKASTTIQYQTVNYASTAAGMAYALHIKLEAL